MKRRRKTLKIDGKWLSSQLGRVRWFNDTFGYGFITHDDGQEVFVHYGVIDTTKEGHKTLKEGEQVRYIVTGSPVHGGLRALHVFRQE